MRDRRFVAEHRGGPLNMEQHRKLMLWSVACVEHVLELYGLKPEERILRSLRVGRAWVAGEASVGDARKASVDMLLLARELTDPVQIALVRASGHAVATAHMADHSMGGALYAIKAVNCAGKSMDEERHWQMEQLPMEVKDFVLEVMQLKARHFKMI
ncbi:MAG: hypothetical protein NTY32_02660 [Bacteroidia bacterium]|nr:hypothetical protein [Bacteroidia bacterium]